MAEQVCISLTLIAQHTCKVHLDTDVYTQSALTRHNRGALNRHELLGRVTRLPGRIMLSLL